MYHARFFPIKFYSMLGMIKAGWGRGMWDGRWYDAGGTITPMYHAGFFPIKLYSMLEMIKAGWERGVRDGRWYDAGGDP